MERRRLLLLTAAVPISVLVGPGRASADPDPPGNDDNAPPPPPPLTVSFEPLENGEAAYLPLAPGTAQDAETAKLVLRLTITNTGPNPLTVGAVSFAFPGSNVPTAYMQGVDIVLGDGGVLASGQAKYWSNGAVTLADQSLVKNQVYLPVPPPATVWVRVYAEGYPTPVQVLAALTPYHIAHPLPFDVADLRIAELISARGDHWANGGSAGTQIYAHDVGVVGWDNASSTWSGLLPGKDGSNNDHYRAWDLPIRAVAEGTIISASDGMVDNAVPGQKPTPTPSPVGGNYVWIGHPDGTRTYYAHLRNGTVAVQAGDPVVAGQVIGRLGNSGNSSGPHTHLEVRRYISGNPLRPGAVKDAWMIERNAGTPWNPGSNLWVPANDRGIPNQSMLIWPSRDRPLWYRIEVPEFIEPEFPPYDWWKFVQNAAECGYEPAYFAALAQSDRTFATALFRPAGAAPVRTRSGLIASEYEAETTACARDGYHPINVTSYLDGSEIRYAGIWRHGSSPEWTGYHGADLDTHHKRLTALTADGFAPANVSVVAVRDEFEVTASYLRSHADVHAPALLTVDEFGTAVAHNAGAGRHLVHVSTTQVTNRDTRFSAVFRMGAPTSVVTDLDYPSLVNAVRLRGQEGQRMLTMAGYIQDDQPRFVAAWSTP